MDFDALFNEKTFQFSDFQEFTVCYCILLRIYIGSTHYCGAIAVLARLVCFVTFPTSLRAMYTCVSLRN